jgi:hypothetical protein
MIIDKTEPPPCHHCGGPQEVTSDFRETKYCWCPHCHARTPRADTEQEAIAKAWESHPLNRTMAANLWDLGNAWAHIKHTILQALGLSKCDK